MRGCMFKRMNLFTFYCYDRVCQRDSFVCALVIKTIVFRCTSQKEAVRQAEEKRKGMEVVNALVQVSGILLLPLLSLFCTFPYKEMFSGTACWCTYAYTQAREETSRRAEGLFFRLRVHIMCTKKV